MYIHRFNFRVRYSEVDRMSIVYHSNYIIWFEMGRSEFLRSLGYTYRELEEEKIWLVVTEIGCKYKAPAAYDEEITIETHIEELGKVKIKFGYRVFSGEKLLTEGFTVHGITNDELRPIPLNRIKPELYKVLADCL